MVTVKINREIYGPRKNDGESRVLGFPTGFKKYSESKGVDTVRSPIDSYGKELQVFEIKDSMSFDMNNKIDKHNLAFIVACIEKYPETYEDAVIIIDPHTQENREYDRSQKIAELAIALRDKSQDESFISSLYQRVVGANKGLTLAEMYKKIGIESVSNPELFYDGEGFIWESDDYETTNLTYNLIRKGFFKEDSLGGILDVDNIKIGNSIADATKALMKDAKLMQKAKSFVNTPKQVEPIKQSGSMDSIYGDLLGDFDGSVEEEVLSIEDFGFNTATGETDEEGLLKLAEKYFEEWKKAEIISVNGVGKHAKYHFYDNPEQVFLKKDLLLNYLVKNEFVLNRYISELGK